MDIGEYQFETLKECIAAGRHLTDCDEDGYCNLCGHQDGGVYPPVG